MRKYLNIPLTVAVTTILNYAMFWPLEAPPLAPQRSNKLIHFIAFTALAFPLAHTGPLRLLLMFIAESTFGGIIELIKLAFNRSAEVRNWDANILGVFIRIGLGLLYRRVRQHRT